jgi:hypothetical protein
MTFNVRSFLPASEQKRLAKSDAQEPVVIALPDTSRANHIAREAETARRIDLAIARAHVEHSGNPWHSSSRSLRLRTLIETLSPEYAATLEQDAAQGRIQ